MKVFLEIIRFCRQHNHFLQKPKYFVIKKIYELTEALQNCKHCGIDLFHLPQVSVFWSQYLAISQYLMVLIFTRGILQYLMALIVTAMTFPAAEIHSRLHSPGKWTINSNEHWTGRGLGGYRWYIYCILYCGRIQIILENHHIITSVLITQIRLRRFNCSSHNSKYRGKSTFS